jgi:protein involved in polysaccharide export with SLBB domain
MKPLTTTIRALAAAAVGTLLLSVAQRVDAQLTPSMAAREAAIYRVQTGDLLRFRLWAGQVDTPMEGDFQVEPSGVAYLPRVGRIAVAGKTIEEVRELLRASYQNEFGNPVVTITPVFPVSVMGAVRQPATIEGTPGLTAFDAITKVGGFLPEANRKEILLIRNGESTRLDASGAAGAAHLAELRLQSNDRVVVEARNRVTIAHFAYAAQILSLFGTLYLALR